MNTPSFCAEGLKWQKVVIQFGSETIKGYLEYHDWSTLEELLVNAPDEIPETMHIRRLGSDTVEEIPTENAKAIFYVEDFKGDSDRKTLHFHKSAPIAHGIWMRLEFLDGEVMEGIVHNTLRYLVAPGFFLRPTDPRSNNRLVYVMKTWLKDHRVLGLRGI